MSLLPVWIFRIPADQETSTHLTDELERKSPALLALGNRYQDISSDNADLYDFELSNGTIKAVTYKLLPYFQD